MWKILVADDEAMERAALKAVILEHFGHMADVRTAADGAAAVEIATLWKADIVLMDIEMPGMNGVEATQSIKRLMPRCEVVFLTAYGLFEYAQEAVRLGVNDYILKPAEDETVLEALRSVMQKLAPPQEKQAPVAEPVAGDKNSRMMQQVEAYLAKNYAHDISLESVSETLGFSSFYFSKLFKQHFGVTFVEYLTDIRMEVAKSILQDPTKSAKEVGEAVGYPSSNYFVKLFKKKTGMTPTEYRNLL